MDTYMKKIITSLIVLAIMSGCSNKTVKPNNDDRERNDSNKKLQNAAIELGIDIAGMVLKTLAR
jgi:uncharacterized lipoprotein